MVRLIGRLAGHGGIRLLRARLLITVILDLVNASIISNDVLFRVAAPPPARGVDFVVLYVGLLGLAGTSPARLDFGILGLHGLAVAVDVDDFPDDAAAVLHDDLGPVAVAHVFAGDVARFTDGLAFVFWGWVFSGWRLRVDSPDDPAAPVLVDDFDDVVVAIFVGDFPLDARLVVGLYRLAFFVVFRNFVVDRARAATANSDGVSIFIP